MTDALFVLMRWLHLTSMATLVGGMTFGRLVMPRSPGNIAPDPEAPGTRAALAYRPLVGAAIAGLIISGIYNLLTSPGHSVRYYTLFGAKLLLALHVFASALLATRPEGRRRARLMTGAVVSGLVIVAIAAYLRRIY